MAASDELTNQIAEHDQGDGGDHNGIHIGSEFHDVSFRNNGEVRSLYFSLPGLAMATRRSAELPG